jgi:uncharacterized protein (DUF1778 family)
LEHIIGMIKPTAPRKAAKTPKRHRMQQRATDEQRDLIQRGADLEGRSVTDFMIAAAQEKAVRIIESMETIRLNAEESRLLAEALTSPPREPNEHQRAALRDYRRLIHQ